MVKSSLVRMRVILFALGGVLVYLQNVIATSTAISAVKDSHGSTSDLRPLLQSLDGILLLAAIVIFVFSFVRIKRDGGELCYDPNNFYWKLMKEAYGDTWGDRVSLCKSYWLTVWLIALPSAMFTLIAFFVFWVIPDLAREIMKDPRAALMGFLKVVGSITLCVPVVAVAVWLGYHWKPMKYIGVVLGIVLIVCLAVVLPIYGIHEDKKIPIASAAGIYVGDVGILIAGAAVIGLIVYAAFKYVKWLRHTWLGQLLGTFKDKMCPTLVACPCQQQAEIVG